MYMAEFSRQHVELGAYTANLTRIVEHVQGMGLDPHGKPPQVSQWSCFCAS